jgi:hypothetical protein
MSRDGSLLCEVLIAFEKSHERKSLIKRTSLISLAQPARSKFSLHLPVSLYVIVCCSLISGDGIAIAASFVSLMHAPLFRDKIDVTLPLLRVVIFFVEVAFLEEEEEDRADAAVGETVRWMAIITTTLLS